MFGHSDLIGSFLPLFTRKVGISLVGALAIEMEPNQNVVNARADNGIKAGVKEQDAQERGYVLKESEY